MRNERELKAWKELEEHFYKSAEKRHYYYWKNKEYYGNLTFVNRTFAFKYARNAYMDKTNEFISWCVDQLKKGFNDVGFTKNVPSEYNSLIAPSAYWQGIYHATMAYYDNRCYLCGCYAEEVHHVRPKELGGSDHPRNLVPLCMNCHKEVHRRLNSGIDFAVNSSIQGFIKT